jgi:hypothetical protein
MDSDDNVCYYMLFNTMSFVILQQYHSAISFIKYVLKLRKGNQEAKT